MAKITMQGFMMIKSKDNNIIINGKDFNVALRCQRCDHSAFIDCEVGQWLHLDEFKLENEFELDNGEKPKINKSEKEIDKTI